MNMPKTIIQDHLDRIHDGVDISKFNLQKLCKSHLIRIAQSLNSPKRTPPKTKANKSVFIDYIHHYIIDNKPIVDEEITNLKKEIAQKENAIEDLQTLRVKTEFEWMEKIADKDKTIQQLTSQVLYLVSVVKLMDQALSELRGQ